MVKMVLLKQMSDDRTKNDCHAVQEQKDLTLPFGCNLNIFYPLVCEYFLPSGTSQYAVFVTLGGSC
jgi:hypothetical protein